jgi:hypothetical protein
MEGFQLNPKKKEELLSPKEGMEAQTKPEKLYRGFVVDPESLSVDSFKQVLEPSSTSGQDGNEKGVYMSDNLNMINSTNYSANSIKAVEVPVYDMGRGRQNRVFLPGCGVVVEINTSSLNIRKPRIDSVLQGHYNNGFQGEEWIADSIKPEDYKVKRFVLATATNDAGKLVLELPNGTEEELIHAIEQIKTEFQKKKKEAEEFKTFLESLPETSRFSGFMLKQKWEKYLQNKDASKNPA